MSDRIFSQTHEKDHNADDSKMDTIYRQAAIDALKQQAETMSEWSNRYAEQRKGVLAAVNIVEDLPSAQPELAQDLHSTCADAISRQAALDALEWKWAGQAAIDAIKNLPSAQQEIIRCKDCKKNPHWEWVGCPMTGKNTRKPDDFCSYAERREE